MSYSTMQEIIDAANQSSGSHCWFSPATMDTWETRIESSVIGGHWFVTSETATRGHRDEEECRVFSVRYCDDDGEVSTAPGTSVGEFADLGDALDAAHTIVRILDAYPRPDVTVA